MAGSSNHDELIQLIEIWNGSKENDRNIIAPPHYQGLSIMYDCREWRKNRPDYFRKFYKAEKEDTLGVGDQYECGRFFLPSGIVELYVKGTISMNTLEEFITILIKEKDKKKKIPLRLPKNKMR